MANKAVSVVYRAKRKDGSWFRFPVSEELSSGWVYEMQPNGQYADKYYPNGKYQLRFYEGDRLVYRTLNTNKLDIALAMCDKYAKKLNDDATVEGDKRDLVKAAARYIQDCKDRKNFEASEQARLVTARFIEVVAPITSVSSITREEIKRFTNALRKDGHSDRTVFNKYNRVRSFMKFCGVGTAKLFTKDLLPKYEKKLPTIYSPTQIAAILEAADDYERIMIELMLKLGLRDQEATYAEYSDVDWSRSVFRVQGKEHYGFAVKDKEQRKITIPADLLARLKKRHTEHKKDRLILPTANGNPNIRMLSRLKSIARREGLNCGRCDGCKSDLKECHQWTLHKFRRTYVTKFCAQVSM